MLHMVLTRQNIGSADRTLVAVGSAETVDLRDDTDRHWSGPGLSAALCRRARQVIRKGFAEMDKTSAGPAVQSFPLTLTQARVLVHTPSTVLAPPINRATHVACLYLYDSVNLDAPFFHAAVLVYRRAGAPDLVKGHVPWLDKNTTTAEQRTSVSINNLWCVLGQPTQEMGVRLGMLRCVLDGLAVE